MKIIYVGGKQAGCIGLLTLRALNHEVLVVKAYDKMVYELAQTLQLKADLSKELRTCLYPYLEVADLLVCVHGRDIIPKDILDKVSYGGINVHPCLYKYKGGNPIQRWLASNDEMASVGVHFMTEDVDMGRTLIEMFVKIDREKTKSVIEVYNYLYPLYSIALTKALSLITASNCEDVQLSIIFWDKYFAEIEGQKGVCVC